MALAVLILIPVFFVNTFKKPQIIYKEPYIKLYLSKEQKTIELLLEDYM